MSKDTEFFKKQTVSKKFYPKEIIVSEACYFQEKHFQLTFYIPQGASTECRYTPQVGVSMKLGNDNLKLFLTDVNDFEQVMSDMSKAYHKHKAKLQEALAKSKKDHWKKQSDQIALMNKNAIVVDSETGEILDKETLKNRKAS